MGKLWGKWQDEAKEKSIAVAILSLFDHCYARGVKDACNVKDEMMCQEFIKKTDTPGIFGFLWKDRDARFDVNTWDNRQFIMEIIYLSTINKSVLNKNKLFRYLARIIHVTTYHFCLLHIAQEFYKQGMLDYLKHPNANKLYTILQNPNGMEWTLDGAKKKGRANTLFRVYQACCDRALRSEEAEEGNRFACNRISFMNFQKSLNVALNHH